MLYHKLEQASLELFRENWPDLRDGRNKRFKQPVGGTYHRRKDVERIDKIDLDKEYKARDFLNIMRARTFSPYESTYVVVNGEKFFLRLSLRNK